MLVCSAPMRLPLDLPKPDFEMLADSLRSSTQYSQEEFRLCDDSVTRIRAEQLQDILRGRSAGSIEAIIIDCRIPYEFNAGHIIGARSMTTFSDLCELFQNNSEQSPMIIFHCEFSHNRGPAFANAFSQLDRKINQKLYPKLSYQNVMILDGGFKSFYNKYPELCTGSYLPMRHDGLDLGLLRRCNSNFNKELVKMKGINGICRNPKVFCSQPVLRALISDF